MCRKVNGEADQRSRCAIGALFEKRRHPTLQIPRSEFFAKRAKALLDLELDEPRVATVQGLAILSCHEAAVMRDTRCWLFSGRVASLAHNTQQAK